MDINGGAGIEEWCHGLRHTSAHPKPRDSEDNPRRVRDLGTPSILTGESGYAGSTGATAVTDTVDAERGCQMGDDEM
ncbi:hypothetical protein N7463_008797 [Penicillium fimorum]|uniref:Uncharacterized protein n=1 Tax=Penicillium fimorum TaxID=1882269 RepID=A0A9X0C432_9EURO|nr:hypothetical protein N7463_008797 [Penicillium fimorum]